MYEATVSIEKENSHLLQYVKDKLSPCIAEIDGIISEIDEQNRCFYSVACCDTYRFQVQRKINEIVAQVLTLGYKNIFIRNLLKVDKDNFFQNVLVNTICIFDSDYDKQIVSREIDVDKALYLDGYYNFRLGTVKKKWREVTKLVSDNFYVLSDNSMVVEFLQYLLESTERKVKRLSVSMDGNTFSMYGSNGNVIVPTLSLAKKVTVEEEAMLNILFLKPQTVKIYHSKPLNSDFCEMLDALFQTEYVTIQ